MGQANSPSRHTTYDTWKQSWNGHRFPPPPSGCVLYYPGYPGQGSIIKDFSGQGNDGTITGATWVRLPSGLVVNGFDGTDDRISIPDSASLRLGSGAFTILAWRKSTQADYTGGVFEKRGGISFITYLGSKVTTGILYSHITDGTNTLNYEGSSSIQDGIWHLLGWTLDAVPRTFLKGYVDGLANGSPINANAVGAINPTGTAYIGFFTDAYIAQSQGLTRVFNRVLSATEIAGVYQSERHLFGV